jgi:hypothetical protein
LPPPRASVAGRQRQAFTAVQSASEKQTSLHSWVVVVSQNWLRQSLSPEHALPSAPLPAPLKQAATTAVLFGAGGLTYAQDSPELQSLVSRHASAHPSMPSQSSLAQSVGLLQLAPFCPLPPGPHQATKFVSAVAAPGNFAKRHVVPDAHSLVSPVPFVVQQGSAQVDPVQSPDRQSRPVLHELPPGCAPWVVERPIHAGLTQ